MNVTIYKNLFEISTPFYRDVTFVLDRIKSGTSRDLIKKIQAEKNKEKRNKLKNQLPAICFSGEFSNRSASGLIIHSGLIALDFDNYSSMDEVLEKKKQLTKDEYTFAVFISPSGNGLKCIVKIPVKVEHHKDYFEALQKHYDSPNFDITCKDVSRVCFESYDPKIFVNKKSKQWTKINSESGHKYTEKVPVLALGNEKTIIEKLMVWFNKNYSMISGKRNANLFVLASAFNEYGISQTTSKYQFHQFISKDFTQIEIDRIQRSAYSKSDAHGTKYFEDNEKVNQIRDELKSGKTGEELLAMFDDVSPEAIKTIAEANPINVFWKKVQGKISIDNFKYKTWLQNSGFFKFYPEGSESFIFIRIENNLIDNTTEVKVKDFVLEYLLKQREFSVYQFMTNQPRFFKEDMLNTLDVVQVSFKLDTKDISYLYFKNCAVQVEKNKITYIDYIDLDGFVWKKHIIDFEYQKSGVECDYKTFVLNVAGQDEGREKSLQSTIGYMLSSFKNSSNNVAVIINDEMISENPNGGTGKGIWIYALSKIKRCAIIDGKGFDFKKSFPYQVVSADTQILVFDDVPKNFSFENLFSVVTEGITLEKKNKDAIKIPSHRSPKILITTNYGIAGDGNSFDRRKWEVEFAQHYRKDHTPLDDFGKLLFDEWSEKEFNNFYSYMIECLQLFLSKGLVKCDFKNLKTRQFVSKTSFDFLEWTKDGKLEINVTIIKSEKYEQFISDYPDHKKWLSRKKFSGWLEKYGEFIGVKTLAGNTAGQRWIEYQDGNGKVIEEQPF